MTGKHPTLSIRHKCSHFRRNSITLFKGCGLGARILCEEKCLLPVLWIIHATSNPLVSIFVTAEVAFSVKKKMSTNSDFEDAFEQTFKDISIPNLDYPEVFPVVILPITSAFITILARITSLPTALGFLWQKKTDGTNQHCSIIYKSSVRFYKDVHSLVASHWCEYVSCPSFMIAKSPLLYVI